MHEYTWHMTMVRRIVVFLKNHCIRYMTWNVALVRRSSVRPYFRKFVQVSRSHGQDGHDAHI